MEMDKTASDFSSRRSTRRGLIMVMMMMICMNGMSSGVATARYLDVVRPFVGDTL